MTRLGYVDHTSTCRLTSEDDSHGIAEIVSAVVPLCHATDQLIMRLCLSILYYSVVESISDQSEPSIVIFIGRYP